MARLALVLALACLAAPAVAQQGAPQRPVPRPAKPPTTEVIFTDDLIEGGRLTPLGEVYTVKPKVEFESLIRVRTNFNDKIDQSFDEL